MAFSPIPSYIIGCLGIALGLHALVNPRGEYPRFGLPLEPGKAAGNNGRNESGHKTGEAGVTSPLIYIKASREASFGLGLIALQWQGNDDGISTLAGILSLAGLTDAIVVWRCGGPQRRHKVWGHALAFVCLAWWSVWRFRHA